MDSAAFWQRWSHEYLHTLQRRLKWTIESPNIKIDDLVILREETTPPLKWPLARIIDVNPGQDGIIRVVTVKTATSVFKRAIATLCKAFLKAELSRGEHVWDSLIKI